MHNFLRVATGLDPWPLLHSLQTQPELWNQYKVRAAHQDSIHKEVDDVVLRYNPFAPGEDFVDKVCSSIHCVDYPPWHKLLPAQVFAYWLIGKVAGVHLGRVMVTRLAPGQEIGVHSDRIDAAELAFPDRVPPALYYERYHVCLQSAPGCLFFCGDEQVQMQPGEAWWFDNQQPHAVVNNSAEDRIHLILDLRTRHDDYIPG